MSNFATKQAAVDIPQFKIGDRITTYGERGYILYLFHCLPDAIVKFDDGSTLQMGVDELTKL